MVLEHHLRERPGGRTRAEVVMCGPWPVTRLYRLPTTATLYRLVH